MARLSVSGSEYPTPLSAGSPNARRVTRLAFGLPADSGVGYSDALTLKRAIGGRMDV